MDGGPLVCDTPVKQPLSHIGVDIAQPAGTEATTSCDEVHQGMLDLSEVGSHMHLCVGSMLEPHVVQY